MLRFSAAKLESEIVGFICIIVMYGEISYSIWQIYLVFLDLPLCNRQFRTPDPETPELP